MIEMTEYGYTGIEASECNIENQHVARVTAVHKDRYEIVCRQGLTYARLKPGVYFNGGSAESFPTAGDFVQVIYNRSGDSQIIRTLPRRTCFSRLDPTPGRGEQIVAANFDTVFIVTSLNQEFNGQRLQRYLTLAWQSGALPAVILTKADLVSDCSEQIRLISRVAAGVAVHAVSVVSGQGMAELAGYFRPGQTVAFLGSSGVGKSSLLNALAGEAVMAVNAIREDDGRGRHTTTHRQLIRLPGGAMIIDTPGMRALGLWDASDGLGEAFGDVEDCLGRCRFSNCTHHHEPGCAIQAALADGQLTEDRWRSYLQLKREIRFSERKEKSRRKQLEHHAKYRSKRQADSHLRIIEDN